MGPYQVHPVEALYLVRDGFPGGADHVRIPSLYWSETVLRMIFGGGGDLRTNGVPLSPCERSG